MIDGLPSHSPRQGSIPNNCYHVIVAALQACRLSQTKRCRNRRGTVACIKGIVPALTTLGETAEAAFLPQGKKLLLASGEQFVGIGLMAHIPNNAIFRGGKFTVQGDCQFDHAEI